MPELASRSCGRFDLWCSLACESFSICSCWRLVLVIGRDLEWVKMILVFSVCSRVLLESSSSPLLLVIIPENKILKIRRNFLEVWWLRIMVLSLPFQPHCRPWTRQGSERRMLEKRVWKDLPFEDYLLRIGNVGSIGKFDGLWYTFGPWILTCISVVPCISSKATRSLRAIGYRWVGFKFTSVDSNSMGFRAGKIVPNGRKIELDLRMKIKIA